MTLSKASNPLAWCTRALPFVITCTGSTAWADQPAAPNIPTPAQKSELPVPYAAWQGTGHAPPPLVEPDSPLPLARPLERPRRPFEAAAALAAFLPSCAAGSVDNRGCVTIAPGAGLHATLLYRLGWFF